MHPEDAARLGLSDRQTVRVTTEAGMVEIELETTTSTRVGMVIIPQGFGLSHDGRVFGVNVNRLTKNTHRDPIAATPLHRHVRCRVEALIVIHGSPPAAGSCWPQGVNQQQKEKKMTLKLTKDSIDLGIVTTEPEKMLVFYRDTLGFEMKGEMPLPKGGRMYRLLCGTSIVKIVVNGEPPAAKPAPGGIPAATGYRYFTFSVTNLRDCVERCSKAGYRVCIPEKEIRPGVVMAMVEDPDGNWVEFLQAA